MREVFNGRGQLVSVRDRLQEIAEREKAATPGLWEFWDEMASIEVGRSDGLRKSGEPVSELCAWPEATNQHKAAEGRPKLEVAILKVVEDPQRKGEAMLAVSSEADLVFLQHARQDVPFLLDLVRRQAEVIRMHDQRSNGESGLTRRAAA